MVLDHDVLYSGSWDTTLRVWDMVRFRSIGKPLLGHKGLVSCLCHTSDTV